MIEHFLNYKLTLRLERLGFNRTEFINLKTIDSNNNFYDIGEPTPEGTIFTPLISETIDWIFLNYNVSIYAYPTDDRINQWTFKIISVDKKILIEPESAPTHWVTRGRFNSHSSAIIAAIEYTLNKIE